LSKIERITDQRAQVVKMRAEGKTYSVISKELGISEATVATRIKEAKQISTSGAIVTGATAQIMETAMDPIKQLNTLNVKMMGIYENSKDNFELFQCNDQVLKILTLQHKIQKDYIDIDKIKVFQETIMEVMDEVHPAMRREFVARLNKMREFAGIVFV